MLFTAALQGCAGIPPDQGRAAVDALLAGRGVDATGAGLGQLAPALLDAIGDQPLGLTDVVQIALVNNPELQAEYARLGWAAADVYDAARISNPRLGVSYLFVERSSLDNERSLGLTQNITDLLMLPARRRLAADDLARVQHSVGAAIRDLAMRVELAYFRLVRATEVAAMHAPIAEGARLSAILAERYFDAGNLKRRELAEQRAAAAEAGLAALKAADAVATAHADLAALLGLPGHAWGVAAGLPAPVADEDDPAQLIDLADRSRLDLAAARRAVAVQADALGVTRRFRYLGDIEIGPKWEWDKGGTRHVGPTLALELPIFNQQAGTVARAEAELTRAESTLASLEIALLADIERAVARVANARARIGLYRESLIPERQQIVARRQEEVNFMLTGPFELLTARQQADRAYQGLLEALGDYWIARTELSRAVGTRLPSDADSAGETFSAPRTADAAPDPAPAAAQDPHMHHHGDHR